MVHYLFTGKSMMKKGNTKQTTMDIFLKRGDTSLRRVPGRSFMGISEESIAIIGDDSSVHVILPLKTLQWDKMWRGRQRF